MAIKHAFKLGDFVRLVVPNDPVRDVTDKFCCGRIVNRETIEDFNGTRTWLGVRWFSENGEPDDHVLPHSAGELELVRFADHE